MDCNVTSTNHLLCICLFPELLATLYRSLNESNSPQFCFHPWMDNYFDLWPACFKLAHGGAIGLCDIYGSRKFEISLYLIMFIVCMKEKGKANRLENGTEEWRNFCCFQSGGVPLFLLVLKQSWDLKWASTILVDAVCNCW